MCLQRNIVKRKKSADNKWKLLDVNDDYSSSVESGFFEDEDTPFHVDSFEELLKLACQLTAQEKRYTRMSMEIVFHAEFMLYFAMNLLDPWYLIPVTEGSPLPTDTLCSMEVAKVRFECAECGKCWTSMQSHATFFYRLNDGIGELYLLLATQECSECTRKADPLWYSDEICRVMRNIFCTISKQLYPQLKCQFSPDYERRRGEPKGRHNSERCLSCREGTCVHLNSSER